MTSYTAYTGNRFRFCRSSADTMDADADRFIASSDAADLKFSMSSCSEKASGVCNCH